MADPPRRSASVARVAENGYQHLVALSEVLRAFRGSELRAATVKALDVGASSELYDSWKLLGKSDVRPAW